ncbi:MAG: MFS transporter [Elusimicrobia bacterium]|nr:MFS transporter [Elusimicrobiota bacterium]
MKLKVPRVSPELLALIGEGFLSRLSFGIVSFALPLYAYHLGMSMTAIGVLFGVNAVAEVSLKPFMSRFADRFGFKPSLSLAIAARSALALMLAFAGAPWQLYGIRLLHGMIESLRDPAINSMLAERGGEKSVASAFSWYWTARYTASAIGKTAAGLLLAWTVSNYKFVFLCAFALSVLPLYVVLRYTKEQPRSNPPEKAASGPEPARARSPKVPILTFAGFGFLITSTSAMLNSLFPLLATKYAHLSEAQTGLIFGVSTTLMLVSGPLFGWLSDNVSRKLVLLIRSASNTISSLLYLIFPTLAGVAVGKVVDDMGKAAFRPAWGAMMAKISGADRARRAQTIGTMTIGENLGETLGPVMGGFLWNTYGVACLLIARAVLALSAELYAIFIIDPHITPSGELKEERGVLGRAQAQ